MTSLDKLMRICGGKLDYNCLAKAFMTVCTEIAEEEGFEAEEAENMIRQYMLDAEE